MTKNCQLNGICSPSAPDVLLGHLSTASLRVQELLSPRLQEGEVWLAPTPQIATLLPLNCTNHVPGSFFLWGLDGKQFTKTSMPETLLEDGEVLLGLYFCTK